MLFLEEKNKCQKLVRAVTNELQNLDLLVASDNMQPGNKVKLFVQP